MKLTPKQLQQRANGARRIKRAAQDAAMELKKPLDGNEITDPIMKRKIRSFHFACLEGFSKGVHVINSVDQIYKLDNQNI